MPRLIPVDMQDNEMNKKEIYLRWAISLCLLACVVCYQLTRPAEEPISSVVPTVPAASSAASSEASSSAASEAESSAAASEEASGSETADSEAAESEANSDADSEAAADSAAASSEASSAASSSKAETETASSASSSAPAASSKAETAASSTAPASSSAPAEPATPRGPYTDGVYTGSGKGFGGKIYVSVTIQNGYIAAVDVTSAEGEDKPYLRDALQIINTVVATQTTKLDAISGATSTTWGILDAIDDALKGA